MMKNIFSRAKRNYLLFLLFGFSLSHAQVGINTDNPKTTLDVEFNANATTNIPPGIRAPNLTHDELDQYTSLYGSLHKGAFVYLTEVNPDLFTKAEFSNITSPGYHFFDGMQWNVFALPNSETIYLNTEPWFSTETSLGATLDTENIYHSAQVGIGKRGRIDPNAQLEITSTSKGLIIPRLSTTERDAITNPTVSMMIWNTDELCFNFYKGNVKGWKSICENTGEAEFTILDCLNAQIVGTYTVGDAVDPSNYILLNVNVTEKGTYNIEGTTEVGLFFQKNGSFPSAGQFSIVIPAYGTPNQPTINVTPTKNINFYINGVATDCQLPITIIKPSTVDYTLDLTQADRIVSETINKGENTTNKKITLKLNVLTAGTTDITATDNSNYGIIYRAYNQELEVGPKTVVLYANGNAVPNTFSGNQLGFTLTGTGYRVLNNENIFNIPIGSNNAESTCTSAFLNGDYTTKSQFDSSNTVSVTVNVTKTGAYSFVSTNTNANIKFTANGTFTRTGSQTFTARASKIDENLPFGIVDNYTFQSEFNGISSCSFNVNLIHAAKKVLFIGNRNNTAQSLLANTNNFGPNGAFRIEALESKLDAYASPSADQLLDYINVQKYEMIVFPVTMGRFTLSAQAYQVLANFITKKKGIVIFTSGTDMDTHVKGIIDRLYPNHNLSFNQSYYGARTTRLPNNSTNDTEEKYLNGPFGNIKNKYYIGYDFNSWLGVTGTLPAGLKTMVNLNGYSNITTRNTFIYTETPGLFVFPGYVTLRDVNKYYGTANPATPSTATYDREYLYMNDGQPPSIRPVPAGESVGYLFLANVFAESFIHLEAEYLPNVNITMYP